MLGRGVLSRLHTLTQQETSTLTLYVDIDQNTQSNRNLGWRVQAEALLKDLRARHPRDRRLREAAARALELLESLDPRGKTALVVVHPGAELAEVHETRVGLPASAHWRRGAFLRPVVEAMDEHERYGVVLTDAQRARLFTVWMGELTEHSDLISETSQRTRTTGTDQWWSEKRFQRRHDGEVALHAKRVIDALHDLALRAPFDRLIVGGPTKAASQLVRLLPTRLHGKLVETVNLAVTASPQEVLDRILELQQRMERQQEVALVEGLTAELHDGGKAVAGLDPVVEAANQGRVWKLVYAKGYRTDGAECRECGAWAAKANGGCAMCGAAVEAAPGFVDRLSQGVMEMGGNVEVVDGDAAQSLEPMGSIAALLRY